MNYDIYCDESRQDLLVSASSITPTNRYCCIGGLMLPFDLRKSLKEEIKKLRDKHTVYGELKWGTVSASKLSFYEELIDLFFSTSGLNFRVVVVDAEKVDNTRYNNGNQELGYYKFYYQLLNHWITTNNYYSVFTDQKTNDDKRRLQELRRIINNSHDSYSPIVNIQAINSEESLILQLENILMGAVGYKYNFNGKGVSSAKEQIVRHIESHLSRPIGKTYSSEQKFNVFEIELKGE